MLVRTVPCLAAVALLSASCFLLADEKPKEAAKPPEKLDAAGTWTWQRELNGITSRSVLKLAAKEGKLTGTYKRQGQTVPISNVKLDKEEISFEVAGSQDDRKYTGKFRGKLSKDAIKGEIELSGQEGSFTLPWDAKRGINDEELIGTWKLKIETPNGETFEPTIKLSAKEAGFAGDYSSVFGEFAAKDVKLDGRKLTFEISGDRDGKQFKSTYEGQIEGNAIKGKVDYDLDGNTGSLAFSGSREPAKADEKKPDAKPAPDKKAGAAKDAPDRRLIVTLKSREGMLLVYSSRPGPLFALKNANGERVVDGLTLKQLQAQHPGLFQLYREAWANLYADK